MQAGVEHVHLGVPDGRADRDGNGVGGCVLPVGDVDGGLGGAVQVVEFGARRTDELGERLRGAGWSASPLQNTVRSDRHCTGSAPTTNAASIDGTKWATVAPRSWISCDR